MAGSTAAVLLSAAVPQLITLAGNFAQQAMQQGVYTPDQVAQMWDQARSEWESAFNDWKAQAATHATTSETPPPAKPA